MINNLLVTLQMSMETKIPAGKCLQSKTSFCGVCRDVL